MHTTPSNSDNPKYGKLFDQMVAQSQAAQRSARAILGQLLERYRPNSVLDVGCGIGSWLRAAQEMDVPTIRGVDGPWLDPSHLIVDPKFISTVDLEKPLDLGSRFDLAICMETAEHLKESAADTLVESLVRHAPAILFSAAIPHQRGPGHVNEQWPNYWAEKFGRHRYGALDFIRASIWYDKDVLWWYRQYVLLFVNYEWCRSQPRLLREAEIQNLRLHPISVVLPDLFETMARRLHDLEEAMKRGGNFTLEVDEYQSVQLTPAEGERVAGVHVTISATVKKSAPQWNLP